MSASGGKKGTVYERLIRINSADRKSGSTSNFTINLGQSLQAVKTVSFLSVMVPNNMYNVYNYSEQFNNSISVSVTNGGGTTVTEVDIEPGWYTSASLMSTLTAAFTAITTPVNLVLTQDPISKIITASITDVATTVVITPIASAQPDWIFAMLGFKGLSVTLNTVPNNASYLPKLGGTPIIYVQSAALSPGHAIDETGLQYDIGVSCPIKSPFQTMNIWDCRVDTLCAITYSRPRLLNTIDIQIVDHKGKVVELHGGDVNIELKVWYNEF